MCNKSKEFGARGEILSREGIANVFLNLFDCLFNIEIYPNPTSDKLQIKIGNYLDFLSYGIEVRDIGGKLLESTTINNAVITFDILKWNVSSGLYYLRIKDPKNKVIVVKKIVIDIE